MSPLRALVLTLIVVCACASIAGAQATAECPTSPCEPAAQSTSPAYAQLWSDASAAHQHKLQFVDAFQRFLRAEGGTFGDEGRALTDALESMGRSLAAWDESIARTKARAARMTPGAEVHVALATMWLDRYRLDEAVRELDAVDHSGDRRNRADVHLLHALALGALNRNQEAVRALRESVALDPDNPVAYYALVQQLSHLGRTGDVSDARRGLERALQRRRTAKRDDDGRFAPFERVDLLRQAPGVAPIFAHARYAAGIAALQAGDYEGAVAKLREAASGDPLVSGTGPAREAIGRAAAMLQEGRLDGALEQMRTAVGAWPEVSELYRLLGLAYWIADEQGKSIEHLRKAMTLAPGDERALVRLADVLVSERRYAEAERELRASPVQSGQITYRLAQIYQRQALLDDAAKAMRESDAFGAVVGRDYFYQSWGSLLVNQADFDGAIAAYARRIEVNPNSAEAHRQIGEIYILQGRHDEALTELSVATWLDPADAKAHAAAGQVYTRLLKYPEAIAALTRALSLDDSLREARYALGTVLMRTGREAEGKAALETFGRQQAEAEALGRRDFEIDALRRQASKQALAGDGSQAIALLQQVLALDPENSRSHRDLGVALLRSRSADEAIEHLRRAQQLEETSEGWALLTEAYATAGNADESARMRAAYADAVRRARIERIRELLR